MPLITKNRSVLLKNKKAKLVYYRQENNLICTPTYKLLLPPEYRYIYTQPIINVHATYFPSF